MTAYKYLFAALAFVASLATAYYIGYIKGQYQAEGTHNELQLEQLRAIISTTYNLTAKAQKNSSDLEKVIAKADEANQKSTREIKNALKATHDIRVSCVFPDSVMQQLESARTRAASAARASEINDLLPTASGSNK